MGDNIYDDPKYWCGNMGYRPPGYGDFVINTIKECLVLLYQPQSILDIGCAYGFSVARFNKLGIKSIGIDISQYALDHAPEYAHPYLIKATAWDMPFENHAFDFAFSSGVLEHIPKRYLKRAITEICRVCKQGLIGVACSDDPTTIATTSDIADTTHKVILSQQEWQNLFPTGFQIISDSEQSWRFYLIFLLAFGMGYKEKNG